MVNLIEERRNSWLFFAIFIRIYFACVYKYECIMLSTRLITTAEIDFSMDILLF